MTSPPPPVPPSGQQHELSAGELRAVAVEVGGGLRELHSGDRPLLDGYPVGAMCDGARGASLVPWPNRVDHGRYDFRGEARQLALTEPDKDCAIHGLARWESWSAGPDAAAANRVALQHRIHGHPGWPHVVDVEVDYTLDTDNGLTVRVSATNVGDSPAPYGYGSHPYLTLGLPAIDECTLQIPGSTWLPTNDRGIPAGAEPVEGTPYDFRATRALGDLAVDYAFGQLDRDGDGRARVRLAHPSEDIAVTLWVDESYGWVEIFTGDTLAPGKRRTGLGVEPMTCPPNAFVTGEGVVVLEPGETHTGTWGITAS